VEAEMVFLVYADANEPRKPNTATVSNTGGRKTPKTLSGIETRQFFWIRTSNRSPENT
jgi:hypothetical protein